MFRFSNRKSIPDAVQCVIADGGQPPEFLATIVATSTVHAAIISQKRENKALRQKWANGADNP